MYATRMLLAVSTLLALSCAGRQRGLDVMRPLCGSVDHTWTLAELSNTRTTILHHATWRKWLDGSVDVIREIEADTLKVAVQIPVRIEPWASGDGVSLIWHTRQYDLYLLSADKNGCFYVSLDPGIAFYRYVGQADILYLNTRAGGWIALNPKGGIVSPRY
jgi:hypothetical protein